MDNNTNQSSTRTTKNESEIAPLGISHISASGNIITLTCSACGTEMNLGREYFTATKAGDAIIYRAAKEIHCTGCDAIISQYSLIPRHKKQKKSSKIPIGGIVVAILLVIGIFGLLSPFIASRDKSDDRSIDAWVCAQNVVSESLKSHSTADFPPYSSSFVEHVRDDEYKISAYVDAENGFGATVRQHFTVVLTLTENGYTDASIDFS